MHIRNKFIESVRLDFMNVLIELTAACVLGGLEALFRKCRFQVRSLTLSFWPFFTFCEWIFL